MRLHLRTKRPIPWSQSKKSIKHAWTIPFMAVEWLCEWIAYFLSNWTFLQILDYVRGFGVIVIVVFYFYDSGNRVKQRHYQAWQVINTAQGKGGNGGRIEALEELNEDHVSLRAISHGQFLTLRTFATRLLFRATFATPIYDLPISVNAIALELRLEEQCWMKRISGART
jgi:hypothetical protein